MAVVEVRGLESTRKKIEEMLKDLGPISLSIGFKEGGTYPNGDSVPFVAYKNEFGVPGNNQPPRPFFRLAVAKNHKKWPTALAIFLRKNRNVKIAMGEMGELIKQQIQQEILDLTEPALSPVTITKKGFDKPLIDKGIMLDNVEYWTGDK